MYYRWVRDRWLHYKDSSKESGYFDYNDSAEIYTNPIIGIINYAWHDFRGIKWRLKTNWNTDLYKDLFGRFTETSEKILTLLHALINGEIITEMSFPEEWAYSNKTTHYKFVQNPLYDNDWTLEKYLHKEWYEDKGYVD